ncbi:hypothetical protein EV643_114232 [Kribbella sp. VKM Ac-2527]|uniref:Uncharacterized protein n=1 Tax=Kribbella caucasensis TaxID=2512215 RepID=A0A4R6K9D2_9ACTN|nr:hypothetical protein [Kribbella sp. VKM Ac-2527]TDO45087.1 hypothetical protein EV643_114232 [Kribbella sp. VKM Ac-2527]
MKTQDRPLDEDDLAMADFAEVADWTKVAGPDTDDTGPAVVTALVNRVMNSTGWTPWPLEPGEKIDDVSASWGFTTRRGTTMVVFNGLAFSDCRNSGWSAYQIGPDDIAEAEDGLDTHWPDHLALARKHWGEPDYIGDDSSETFIDEWAPGAGVDRRHLAVWVRPGAQIHLFSNKPTRDPLTPAVGVNYAVYID